eukprot:TRINITY_DN97604_c0_g1_i1.p2 TRINITY_DN97604_c0_g1~~TRINITY_DN97604_c0_g1_i1.p2  ORF type:complete len:171 (+),score=22.41 TRINITY_DN97604_c0_g1_i1:130-642(+)
MPKWDPAASAPRPVTIATGFHAHCYFDTEQTEFAEKMRNWLIDAFISRGEDGEPYKGKTFNDVDVDKEVAGGGCSIGAFQPIDEPHTKAYFLCAFHPRVFGEVVRFITFNHGPLSVLIHPDTSDVWEDHTINALWLGERLNFKWKGQILSPDGKPIGANKGKQEQTETGN